MTETRKPVGYLLRYLPAVYQLGYEEMLKTAPELSLPDYVATLNDTGEPRVIRVYEDEGGRDLVLFGRTSIGDGIPKKDREHVIEHFNESLLRKLFENNSVVLGMRGIREFDHAQVEDQVYGVPLEVYLSGYWYLLEQTELFEIGKGDFVGVVETDRGKFQLSSI